MSKFKVIFAGEEEDPVFDTEEEALDYAAECRSNDRLGAEMFHLSNPGDYDFDPDDYESPDYEIIEIND